MEHEELFFIIISGSSPKFNSTPSTIGGDNAPTELLRNLA